jgi:deoxyribonucleoside regulator
MDGGEKIPLFSTEEMIKVSKMYYELKLTQKEISERLCYSRPTVSRIIDSAFKKGIIKVQINYESSSLEILANKIKEKYHLNKVIVTPNYLDNEELIRQDVGKALAEYLFSICTNGTILGLSWGTSLSYTIPFLKKSNAKDIVIVQLNGGIAKNTFSTGSSMLLEKYANAFSSNFYLLPLPTIVDSVEMAEIISKDSIIEETLLLGKKANIAVFGIGNTSLESVLYKGGYFKDDSYTKLVASGAVGDICSRYYDKEGKIVDIELNRRTIGLELEDLKLKDRSIAIATGISKLQAVLGALKGGYINELFIDEGLAKKIILEERL